MARIDVSKPGFLARRDLPPIPLLVLQKPLPIAPPLPQASPDGAVIPVEEVASSLLSLEEEIDKFHFKEEQSLKAPLICISDAEGESDRSSGVYNPYLILAHPDNSDEVEDSMALNKVNKSLRDLMAARGKESTSKIAPKSQVAPPLPPQIPIDLGLKACSKKEKDSRDARGRRSGSSEGDEATKRWSLRLGAGGPNP